jgi:hypothetical protein
MTDRPASAALVDTAVAPSVTDAATDPERAKALQTKFGFTPERVAAAARETLARARARH